MTLDQWCKNEGWHLDEASQEFRDFGREVWDYQQERIALLEAVELGFMKTSLEYKRRITLLEAQERHAWDTCHKAVARGMRMEAAIRKHRDYIVENEIGDCPEDESLWALIQEQEDE